jgi:hypothetical protein
MAAGQSGGSADKGSVKAEGGPVSAEAVPAKAVPGSAEAVPGDSVQAEPDDMDDLKRKFREALDRKKGKNAAGNADGAQSTGKVHDAHGPAASRRSFRRKSGG